MSRRPPIAHAYGCFWYIADCVNILSVSWAARSPISLHLSRAHQQPASSPSSSHNQRMKSSTSSQPASAVVWPRLLGAFFNCSKPSRVPKSQTAASTASSRSRVGQWALRCGVAMQTDEGSTRPSFILALLKAFADHKGGTCSLNIRRAIAKATRATRHSEWFCNEECGLQGG